MFSRLKPDSATIVGVLTAGGVYAIYNGSLPSITDVRAAQPHDDDVNKACKQATWKSALLVGAVFLVSRDLNSYIISGAALVAMDLSYKHANAVHPMTGKASVQDDSSMAPGMDTAYALPSYADTDS